MWNLRTENEATENEDEIMSQGIIATVVTLCFLILIMTGWFTSLTKTFKVSKTYIVLLLSSYVVLTNYWFAFPNSNIVFNIGGTLIPIISLLWIYCVLLRPIQISETISASMLAASLLLLVYEIFPKDPKLFVFDHFITYPIILTITTVIIIKNPMNQQSMPCERAIGTVILAVMILDIISVFFVPKGYTGYIGDGQTNDLLFFTIPLVIFTYRILDNQVFIKGFLYLQRRLSVFKRIRA